MTSPHPLAPSPSPALSSTRRVRPVSGGCGSTETPAREPVPSHSKNGRAGRPVFSSPDRNSPAFGDLEIESRMTAVVK